LPEFEIKNLSDKETLSIFELLIKGATNLSDENTVWFNGSEKKCNSFSNFQDLFYALKDDSRHILLEGICFNSTTLPPIGCIIYNNKLEIDYRMGNEWNNKTFSCLIYFFLQIKKLSPDVVIEMPIDGESPFLSKDIKKLNRVLKGMLS